MVFIKLKRILSPSFRFTNFTKVSVGKICGSKVVGNKYKRPRSLNCTDHLSVHNEPDDTREHASVQLNATCQKLVQLTVQVEDLTTQTEPADSTGQNRSPCGRLRKVSRHVQRGMAEAEFLVVVKDYIESMEQELERVRKLVGTMSLKNRSLQRRILHKHQEWLDWIHECELLRFQLSAWRFALSLYDPNFSCLTGMLDSELLNMAKPNKTESDMLTSLSSMPWIWLHRTKTEFWTSVNQLISLGQMDRAVQIIVETFGLNKLIPASQRHRWLPHYVLEFTKVLDYLSLTALYCFQKQSPNLALVCANHAIRLLLSISPNRNPRFLSGKQPSAFDYIDYFKQQLTSATIHETEWAVLLECCRRLVQVYWLAKRHQEAVSLLFGILGARRLLIGHEEKLEGWKSGSQLACLLTGGLCLFSSHVNRLSLLTYGQEDQIALSLTELAMNWLEAALSVHLSRSQNERTSELTESSQGPAFYLWSITTASLGRQCSEVGSVFDVFLLATRVISILAQFEPWCIDYTSSLTQILSRALQAEWEMGGKNLINESENGSEISIKNESEAKNLDIYLRNIQCPELIEPVEALMQEVILVCRGQKWETAAAVLEWWIIGCQMRRQRATAEAMRSRKCRPGCTTEQNNDKSNRRSWESKIDIGHELCTNSESYVKSVPVRSKYRAIQVRFLHFLIQLQTLKFHSNNILSSNLSQLNVGKYRECVPDELICNLFGSGQDFRVSCFSSIFHQLFPLTISLLENLASRGAQQNSCPGLLTENQLILASNKKLLSWWKHAFSSQRHIETVQISPFLDGRSLVHMWDENAHLLQNELQNALVKIRHTNSSVLSGPKEFSTKLLKRFQIRPLVVTRDIVNLVGDNPVNSPLFDQYNDKQIPNVTQSTKSVTTNYGNLVPLSQLRSTSSELFRGHNVETNRIRSLRQWIHFRRKQFKNAKERHSKQEESKIRDL
ncbi:hypothetical protein FBUS_00526 [Fasciolopsis buskii]|uniref:Uncharacterized protein n=1 Tax=Fasciolopsis buskii TaxID=27845 RepID=A0A8E0S5G2_9TREM|nr:hypothetical protein FBUS_00526 [Fasciolopsis buski]